MILCLLTKINMFSKKYFDIVLWIKDEKKILLTANRMQHVQRATNIKHPRQKGRNSFILDQKK